MIGTTAGYFALSNRRMQEGRIFAASGVRSGAAVCVIGETVRDKLFGRQSPIGSRIRLQKLSCEVIGLIKSKGQSSMGQDQDDIIVVPLRTLQRRIADTDRRIDRLVYDLYGLTDDEIRIVEGTA